MKRITCVMFSIFGVQLWTSILAPTALALPPGSGALYFVHNDPSGTPQALTDESGKVVWTAETDPFGGAKVNEDPDGDGQLIEFNVRAPGQYYDKETGLHYNYFRHYDPTAGRYLSSDPIGLSGGLNTYAHVANNPYRFTDPYGLASWPFHSPVKNEVGQRLSDSVPPGTPPIPGKTREQTIEFLSNEIADRITNREALACKTSAQRRKEVGKRLLNDMKQDFPQYPWNDWQPFFEQVWK